MEVVASSVPAVGDAALSDSVGGSVGVSAGSSGGGVGRFLVDIVNVMIQVSTTEAPVIADRSVAPLRIHLRPWRVSKKRSNRSCTCAGRSQVIRRPTYRCAVVLRCGQSSRFLS